jgi:hypothetical protein
MFMPIIELLRPRGNRQFAGWRRNFILINCAPPIANENYGTENSNPGKSEGGFAAQ